MFYPHSIYYKYKSLTNSVKHVKYLLVKTDNVNNDMLTLLTKATNLEQQFQKNTKNTIILFIDLQSYTQYKTTHTFFESLRKILTHNTIVSDFIRKNNGVIIKWLGDGIMARFTEKDILKSVKASVEIQRFFANYNNDKSKEDKIRTKIGGIHRPLFRNIKYSEYDRRSNGITR